MLSAITSRSRISYIYHSKIGSKISFVPCAVSFQISHFQGAIHQASNHHWHEWKCYRVASYTMSNTPPWRTPTPQYLPSEEMAILCPAHSVLPLKPSFPSPNNRFPHLPSTILNNFNFRLLLCQKLPQDDSGKNPNWELESWCHQLSGHRFLMSKWPRVSVCSVTGHKRAPPSETEGHIIWPSRVVNLLLGNGMAHWGLVRGRKKNFVCVMIRTQCRLCALGWEL